MTNAAAIPSSPNVQPIFIKSPLIASIKLTNQTCDRNPTPGTNPPPLLYSGGSSGGLIETIEIYPLGNNIKSVLRLYYTLPFVDGYQLFREVALPAVATSPSDDVITGYPIRVSLPKVLSPASPTPATPNEALRVPNGAEIRIALGVAIASGVVVTATGGDY